MSDTVIFIDREAREIIRLVVSVRPSVCPFESGRSPDLCVFVSNQETFEIKSCAQQSGAFNFVSFPVEFFIVNH